MKIKIRIKIKKQPPEKEICPAAGIFIFS